MNLFEEYTLCGCGFKRLVNNDDDTVLLSGDDYHNKINYQIEGYKQALNDNNIDFTYQEGIIICPYCDE